MIIRMGIHFPQKYPDLPIIAGKDSPLVTYTPSDKKHLN